MEAVAEVGISPKAAIGFTAGKVWHLLHDQGRMSMTRLIKSVDAPRDLVLQAIGWLAREDKIEIEETSRGRLVWLKEE
ncbi:MAG: hypothetical protein KatS3mg109_1247 [Pirellulaceae bacterium]|nr:MAG: hypothetical protein KatS3mg109_1247 [Pirellulaceae bacterium]GIW93818.1 MAG: hypothetical protein KatS3mg110_1859 [Pirellulaceae bacterium]